MSRAFQIHRLEEPSHVLVPYHWDVKTRFSWSVLVWVFGLVRFGFMFVLTYMYVCASHVRLMPAEVIEGTSCSGTGVRQLSSHVGAGSRTWVLSKGSQCSNHWAVSPDLAFCS